MGSSAHSCNPRPSPSTPLAGHLACSSSLGGPFLLFWKNNLFYFELAFGIGVSKSRMVHFCLWPEDCLLKRGISCGHLEVGGLTEDLGFLTFLRNWAFWSCWTPFSVIHQLARVRWHIPLSQRPCACHISVFDGGPGIYSWPSFYTCILLFLTWLQGF